MFYGEAAFTKANLSDVRVIMEIMHVLMEESLSQAVLERISVCECLFVKCVWVPTVTSFHARH
jgi:hypothetical protein